MPSTFDIAILGATPAGLAAAIFLASHKRQVTLIDAPSQPAESPLADWAPRHFFRMPHLPKAFKALEKSPAVRAFSQVVYHNSDLTKQVQYASRGAVGYFFDSHSLCKSLRSAAVKAGVKLRQLHARPAIQLQEDGVRLLASCPIQARLLMIAYNRPGDVVSDLSLPIQNVPQPPMVVAALDVPLGPGHHAQGSLHIVETRERTELGMFFVNGRMLHIRLISSSIASGTRAEELSALVGKLQKSSLVPGDLVLAKSTGAVWHPPAGMALELETHVAKRCMLIGTAGGFAESITGQTLYPSIKSALVAAQIAHTSLDHPKTQEELMRFKTAWRKNLADYLRPPNTSLQMLLPLLFVNQQIVAKFTKALLFGESI